MNQLAMDVVSFLGGWFVVSVVLGLFIGVCIDDKRRPALAPAGRLMLPAWAPEARIERRRTLRYPVAVDRRARRTVHVA
jgi:hypothetical protein